MGPSRRQRCHIITLFYRNLTSATFRTIISISIWLYKKYFPSLQTRFQCFWLSSWRVRSHWGDVYYCLFGHSILTPFLSPVSTLAFIRRKAMSAFTWRFQRYCEQFDLWWPFSTSSPMLCVLSLCASNSPNFSSFVDAAAIVYRLFGSMTLLWVVFCV